VSSIDQQFLEALVEIVLERVQAQIVQAKFLGASLQELDTPETGIHEVLLDGELDTVPAHDVTTGTALAVGDQVAVVFTPPHQFWIIGKFDTG
jgi:hypothetical protein